jgi:ribosomal protein S18 acetylase RimI-like enzyme
MADSTNSIENLRMLLIHLNELKVGNLFSKDGDLINSGNDVWPNFALLNSIGQLQQHYELLNTQIIIFNLYQDQKQLLKSNNIFQLDYWYAMEKNKLSKFRSKQLFRVQELSDLKIWADIATSVFYPNNKSLFEIVKKVFQSEKIDFFLFNNFETPIGTAMVFYDTQKAGVYFISIQKDHQKLGYGKKLILELEGFICQKGIESIVLQSTRQGLEMYKKVGYSINEKINLFFKYERNRNI